MYAIIAGCIIALAAFENIWPAIAGFFRTPPGFVFLGTVHHPADYFYYLSQFAQGGYRWITTVNLFTNEPVAPSFVGWSNVLVGRVFHFFGISPLIAYQVSVVIFTVILLVAGYRLAYIVLASQRPAGLALYLFALFHAFPILRDGKPSYGDYWNNFAIPRVRLGGVPHQLLLHAASILMVYFIIQWIQYKKYTVGTLVSLGVSSLILASLQPVLWGLIMATLGIAFLSGYWLKLSDKPAKSSTPKFLMQRIGVPFFVLVSTGLPPVLYLTRLFTTLPFSQLKLWEAGAQNALTPEHFLSSTGPVFLIALFSLPLFASHLSFAKIFVILFSLFSLLLLLSPLPVALGLSQARFISTLTILCLSVIASSGLMHLFNAKGTITRMSGALLIVGISLLLIPNHFKTLELSSSFDPGNAYYYLPAADYEFLQKSGRIGKPDDTFLVTWPYNVMFPAITGKRTYHGHPLLTIASQEKDALAIAALNGSMTPEATRAFYADNDIAYLIGTTDNVYLTNSPLVTRVSASKTLVLYKVL
ncbi:MAG: hypothetical protein AAB542_02285 [Patescibacteria group bacterium]